MFLSEDTTTQLVRLSASLPAVCEGFANHAASCSVRVGIRVGIVGSLIDFLQLSQPQRQTKCLACHVSRINQPFLQHEPALERQTWTRRCPRRLTEAAEPLRLKSWRGAS